VACSSAAAFVVRTIRVRPVAAQDLEEPDLAAPDSFQVTITY
jgi:hypothetical protein